MLNSRNKRIHSQYDKKSSKNQTFINQQRQNNKIVDRSSSLSNERQSFLTNILRQINQEKAYDRMSLQQIMTQRDALNRKIREMNRILGKVIEKSIQKRTQQERISKKAIIGRQMGINYNQLCKQYVQNTNKINALEDEFHQNNQKLQLLCDPNAKFTLAQKVAESQTKIKQIKDQLLRIKKNKFLRERQIIKGNDKDKAQIQDLQLEYITLAKKQEYLITKTQKIEQQKSDGLFNLAKQKQYFQELRYQCAKLDQQNLPNVNQEHLAFLYQSHKKKLEIHMKRNQRDDETMKRKYYNLLLQYQNCKNKIIQIDSKCQIKQQESEKALIRINQLLQQFDQVKMYKIDNRFKRESPKQKKQRTNPFMLTQIEQQKRNIRIRPETTDIYKQQNKSSHGNSKIRKWNLKVHGSIVRQQTESSKQLSNSIIELNQIGRIKQNLSRIKNTKLFSKKTGKIRRNKTQVSPGLESNSYYYNLSPQEQQSYTSDFEPDQSLR